MTFRSVTTVAHEAKRIRMKSVDSVRLCSSLILAILFSVQFLHPHLYKITLKSAMMMKIKRDNALLVSAPEVDKG